MLFNIKVCNGTYLFEAFVSKFIIEDSETGKKKINVNFASLFNLKKVFGINIYLLPYHRGVCHFVFLFFNYLPAETCPK